MIITEASVGWNNVNPRDDLDVMEYGIRVSIRYTMRFFVIFFALNALLL